MPDNEVKCGYCDEPITEADLNHPELQNLDFDFKIHIECAIRMTAGSVSHQQKLCSCFVPGSPAHDEPGLTRREAAKQAQEYYYQTKFEKWDTDFRKKVADRANDN